MRAKKSMKIEEMKDIERVIARMINECLTCPKSVEQAGRISALANAFTAARRLRMELEDMKRIDEKVNELLGTKG